MSKTTRHLTLEPVCYRIISMKQMPRFHPQSTVGDVATGLQACRHAISRVSELSPALASTCIQRKTSAAAYTDAM